MAAVARIADPSLLLSDEGISGGIHEVPLLRFVVAHLPNCARELAFRRHMRGVKGSLTFPRRQRLSLRSAMVMASSYTLVTHDRAGREHSRPYTSQDPLSPASIVLLAGRYWLVERLEQTTAHARPARYRLTLRHPDGRLETGAFSRFRADAPTVGHQLTTLEAGAPVSWAVVEQQLARDEAGYPFLDLIADRDYAESESLPSHELEHTLDQERDDTARPPPC